jgi:hypothetical protein
VHTHLAVVPVSYATYCLAQRHSIKGWQNASRCLSLTPLGDGAKDIFMNSPAAFDDKCKQGENF